MEKIYYLLNDKQQVTKISRSDFEGNSGFILVDPETFRWYPKFSKIINGVFISGKEEYKKYLKAKHEKRIILKWLADNDWKINKIVIGEWTVNDTRWIEYLNERFVKRQRLDEVSALLEQYEYEV